MICFSFDLTLREDFRLYIRNNNGPKSKSSEDVFPYKPAKASINQSAGDRDKDILPGVEIRRYETEGSYRAEDSFIFLLLP